MESCSTSLVIFGEVLADSHPLKQKDCMCTVLASVVLWGGVTIQPVGSVLCVCGGNSALIESCCQQQTLHIHAIIGL